MKIYLYIIMILVLANIPLDAASKCSVNGKIIDFKTNEPITGATIRLEKTPFGAISKSNGEFLIQNIPAGNYNLIISFIGYEISEQKVNLKAGENLTVNVSIKSQPLRTEEIVVSANKRIQAVQDVPVTTSVIDSRSLQERNIVKADEALQYISGVNLIGDQVSIRGSSGFAYGVGSRVAFLIDGMPVLSGDQGDIKFDALPIFNIERIEIVKGAGSALYGTGALGGVINLITKEPLEQAEYKIRTFAGIYTKPTYKEWQYRDNLSSFAGFDAGFSQKTGNLGITLSGGTKRDESYTLFNDSFRWNLFSKLKYNFSNSFSLSMLGSFATEDKAEWVYWNSLDSATRPPTGTDLNTRINSSKLTLNADFQYIFDNGDFLDYKSGWYSTDFKNNLKTDNAEYRASKANSIYNEITLNNRLGEKFLLTYGLNHSLNTVDASIYGKKD
ncbi:MAG: TonB-dependent receptor, partial [Bacteroidota bacterium]